MLEGLELNEYRKHAIEKACKSANETPLLNPLGRRLLCGLIKYLDDAERWNAVSEKADEEQGAWLINFFVEKLGEDIVVLVDPLHSASTKRILLG